MERNYTIYLFIHVPNGKRSEQASIYHTIWLAIIHSLPYDPKHYFDVQNVTFNPSLLQKFVKH